MKTDALLLSKRSPRLIAILQAVLVTVLWSSSWVLIKFGLADIPALTFAGLRYSLAFLCLAPFAFSRRSMPAVRALRKADWLRLALLGLLYYTLTQGAQFLALAYLPAITTTLLLNFSGIAVALLGIVLLAERPGPAQWVGALLNILGVLIYFYPVNLPSGEVLGIIFAMTAVLANAVSSVLGRSINRDAQISPLLVTAISMGIGAVILLAAGLATQGLPALSLKSWLIIAVLAVVNTAFAFTLWNRSLQVLSAMESSIINNTMTAQIALLAWIFLDERITWLGGIGLLLAVAGVGLVQIRKKDRSAQPDG